MRFESLPQFKVDRLKAGKIFRLQEIGKTGDNDT
jgi:hypothetical protein